MIDVGVGFPAMFPSVGRDLLLDWSRAADRGPFASLSGGERLGFDGGDLLVCLSMAAAATQRIKLMTTVLALPLHREGVLAKQAATLDRLTNGRLVLGLGISERPLDFLIAGVEYEGRGNRFEEQLQVLRRVWRGEPAHPGAPPVGPIPVQDGGPEVLIGAFTKPALQRAGRMADGLVSFGFSADPAPQRDAFEIVEREWKEAGRPGRPRFVAGTYFALGPDAPTRAEAWLRDYYGYLPAQTVQYFVDSVTTTSAEGVAAAIDAFAAAGADEVYFSPMIPELDQVERLAELVPTA